MSLCLGLLRFIRRGAGAFSPQASGLLETGFGQAQVGNTRLAMGERQTLIGSRSHPGPPRKGEGKPRVLEKPLSLRNGVRFGPRPLPNRAARLRWERQVSGAELDVRGRGRETTKNPAAGPGSMIVDPA